MSRTLFKNWIRIPVFSAKLAELLERKLCFPGCLDEYNNIWERFLFARFTWQHDARYHRQKFLVS